MRRSSSLLAALALVCAASSLASADEASILAKAKALVDKTLPQSEVQKIEEGKAEDKAKSGDWTFEIAIDDPGVVRYVSTSERGKGGLALTAEAHAETRCGSEDSSKPWFTLGSDDRLPLKGAIEKGQYAEAWASFADGASFVGRPTKLKLDFSQNDASLSLPIDAARFANHDAVAFCAAAGRPDARCLTFSLKGFARAYDFLCQAK